MYITCPIHMCDMTPLYFTVTHTAVDIFHMCAITQLHVWHDSYICVRLPTATHTATHAATHTATHTACLLPRSVEKRPRRLRLEIEIEIHSKLHSTCNRLYVQPPWNYSSLLFFYRALLQKRTVISFSVCVLFSSHVWHDSSMPHSCVTWLIHPCTYCAQYDSPSQ